MTPPVVLDQPRSFVGAVELEILEAMPDLLDLWVSTFDAADEVTLVVVAEPTASALAESRLLALLPPGTSHDLLLVPVDPEDGVAALGEAVHVVLRPDLSADDLRRAAEQRWSECAVPQLAAPVKLLIWDLDDTFWAGTLSEERPLLVDAHVRLLRRLNRAGIINAICSKNDLAAVRDLLEEVGLWDEFVLPSIDWEAKGPRIRQLIEDAQLRAVNVLFVDDNALNLREAEHFAPGLQTLSPEHLLAVADQPALTGRPDPGMTRVQQYRALEARLADRAAARGSNEEFLRDCRIEAYVDEDPRSSIDRIAELESRGNQLNFTKRRIDAAEVHAQLADPTVRVGAVHVRDRYGDHGLVGYYAIGVTGVMDLAFSCRVLNMGIEQALWQRLGRPEVDVVGEVASRLEEPAFVDWVSFLDAEAWAAGAPHDGPGSAGSAAGSAPGSTGRTLVVGGCDLEAMIGYLNGADVVREFNFVAPGGAAVHRDHTALLRQAVDGLTAEQVDLVDRIPFLTPEAFRTAVGSDGWDCVVHSPLMDLTQGIYRSASTGLVVPYGDFTIDLTDPARRDAVATARARVGIDHAFLDWFAEEFVFEGQITPDAFAENLRWLRSTIPAAARLVLLNGAEVEPLDGPEHEVGRALVHRRFNAVIDRVAAELPNTVVADVRTVVRSRDDLTDNLRHYSRRAYRELAAVLEAVAR